MYLVVEKVVYAAVVLGLGWLLVTHNSFLSWITQANASSFFGGITSGLWGAAGAAGAAGQSGAP
jgi:hypothetical protein